MVVGTVSKYNSHQQDYKYRQDCGNHRKVLAHIIHDSRRNDIAAVATAAVSLEIMDAAREIMRHRHQ